jgi:hypothetical protein
MRIHEDDGLTLTKLSFFQHTAAEMFSEEIDDLRGQRIKIRGRRKVLICCTPSGKDP